MTKIHTMIFGYTVLLSNIPLISEKEVHFYRLNHSIKKKFERKIKL